MISIFQKEINTFFSSLIAYVVMGVFLVFLGLFVWVFPDTSVLTYKYASLDTLFSLAPLVFLFLIPAITMRSFSDEISFGTIEVLRTKPLKIWDIILGKYFASLFLVGFTLLPTIVYYYSIYQLGSPKGNLDSGGILGSYIGLFFLGSVFVSIGIWTSSLSKTQIVAFILAAFVSFLMYFGFEYASKLTVWGVTGSQWIDSMGISSHYSNISRGVLDSNDIIYFISANIIFLILTRITLQRD